VTAEVFKIIQEFILILGETSIREGIIFGMLEVKESCMRSFWIGVRMRALWQGVNMGKRHEKALRMRLSSEARISYGHDAVIL
jgi:hypothetical protein